VTLIEALACAKPIITTDVGGIRDVLQYGKYGCLETLDNPEKFASDLISIFMNYQDAQTKANLGQKYILANYDVKVLYKNIHALYSGCQPSTI